MTTQTHHVDHELIQAAAHVARTRCRGDNHTMAAAARVLAESYIWADRQLDAEESAPLSTS